MSDEGKPLQPEHLFKRIAWHNILAVSGAIEQFITWTITGIAAIVGLIISNVNSVSNIISLEDLRIAIILFTMSLLSGVLSKMFGVAVSNGLKTTDKIDNFFKSDEGKSLLQNITFDFIRMEQELSSPFY